MSIRKAEKIPGEGFSPCLPKEKGFSSHFCELCGLRRSRLGSLCAHGVNSVRGAGAPSPPSEEGGGTAYKGLKRRDGRRDTPSMCENTLYRQWQKQMTAFSLRARLHLGANSDLALSLPQSSPLYPKRLDSSLLRGSRGGSAANRTDLILLSKFSVNAIPCRRYNPSVFSACKTSRKASSPCTGEPRSALRLPCRAQREPRSALRSPCR